MSTPEQQWQAIEAHFNNLRIYLTPGTINPAPRNQIISFLYEALQHYDPNDLQVRQKKQLLAQLIVADMTELSRRGAAVVEQHINKRQLVESLLAQSSLLEPAESHSLMQRAYQAVTSAQQIAATAARVNPRIKRQDVSSYGYGPGQMPPEAGTILAPQDSRGLDSASIEARAGLPPAGFTRRRAAIPGIPTYGARESSGEFGYDEIISATGGAAPQPPVPPTTPPEFPPYLRDTQPHVSWDQTTVYPPSGGSYEENIRYSDTAEMYKAQKAQRAKSQVSPGSEAHKYSQYQQIAARTLKDQRRELTPEEEKEINQFLRDKNLPPYRR